MKAGRVKGILGTYETDVRRTLEQIERLGERMNKSDLEYLRCELIRYGKYNMILKNTSLKPLHERVSRRKQHCHDNVISKLIAWKMNGVESRVVEMVLRLIKK